MMQDNGSINHALHTTIPTANPDFENALREQLLAEYRLGQPDKPIIETRRRTYRVQPSILPLTLVAALLMVIAAILILNTSLRTTSIAAFPLPDLQPITSASASNLRVLGQLGTGRIEKLAWSPDGEMLAVAGSLGIWIYEADALNAGEQQLLTSPALDVTYSPDGTLLASAHEDGSVRMWDTNGNLMRTLEGDGASLISIAFSPDGTMIAAGSGQYDPEADEAVHIWSVASGEEFAVLDGHNIGVWNVEFSPDNTQLVSHAMDGATRLWDVQTGALLNTIEAPDIGSGYFLSNSVVDWARQRVGFIDQTGIHWYRFDSDTPVITPLAGQATDVPGAIRSIDSANGLLAIGSYNVGVAFYDLTTDPIQPRVVGDPGMASDVEFSPDGQQVAAISHGNALYIFDVSSGEAIASLHQHLGDIRSMTLTHDASTLYVAVSGGPIHVWNVESGEEQSPILTGDVSAVLLSHDNQTLIYSGERLMSGDQRWSSIWVRDMTSGQELGFPLATSVGNLVISPRSDTLAGITSGGNVQLLDPYERQVIRTMASAELGRGNNVSLAFSPDETRILTGTDNGHAQIYNVETGQLERSIYTPMPGQNVDWVGYSPDGRFFFTGAQLTTGEDGGANWRGSALQLWDAETARNLYYFDLSSASGERQFLTDTAFNADSSLLAAAASGNLTLWDTETGEQVTRLTDANVDRILFSGDGRLMITSGWDGVIQLWGVPQ